ncbi:MAG: universal stress protein [Aliihoeflea sp.]|uniref:universal stress protein n=1 Tax=Aliihoeflea sp. TaxID=2608088 RepID=UPI004037CC59
MLQILVPVSTYPTPPKAEQLAAIAAAAKGLGGDLEVLVHEVVTPQVASALGRALIDVASLRKEIEDRCREDARSAAAALEDLAKKSDLRLRSHEIVAFPADFSTKATIAARYCDLSIILMRKDDETDRHLAESIIFGSGRPVLLVPETCKALDIQRIAVAWDGSRVAARALGDAAHLFPDASIDIVTVTDEKRIEVPEGAKLITEALGRSARKASLRQVRREGSSIAVALQEAALSQQAGILAMGGFGHSRLRDFVLGGATAGVLADVRLPILVSH